MRRPITGLGRAVFAAGLLAACAAAPTEEIRAAKTATEAARAAGAEQYAAREYTAAVAALRGAEQAVERRDNREALRLALESRRQAQEAARAAADGRQAAQAEAAGRVQDLQAAVDEARRRVAAGELPGAARTRAEQLALSDTRRAIVVANVALQKARTAIAAGDYGAARQATEGVADHLRAVTQSKPRTSEGTPGPGQR